MEERKYTAVEIALLAEAFGKSTQTISRWIKNGNDILTSEKAKSVLNTKKK